VYGNIYAKGRYRGSLVNFSNLKETPVPQPTLDLRYRGVDYRTNEIGNPIEEGAVPSASIITTSPESPAEAVKATTLSVEEQARSLMMNHHRHVRQRQQSMLTRLDEEVGLTVDDALHFWNHIQGKVHPSFWATYDRSHAGSMS
jgi:hypothetical protein